MGGGGQDARKKAIRALRKQHRGDRVEQALKQLDPPRKRGPKRPRYLKGDAALMLEAYDEYLRMVVRLRRKPAGRRHPKPSTHRALKLVAEKAWTDPKRRGGASTLKAFVKRLITRFNKGGPQPRRSRPSKWTWEK